MFPNESSWSDVLNQRFAPIRRECVCNACPVGSERVLCAWAARTVTDDSKGVGLASPHLTSVLVRKPEMSRTQ